MLGPPSPFVRVEQLDLFTSLQYGIQNSRQYQDQLEALYESALNVTLQHHLLLEPQPFATVSVGYSGGQKDAELRSALTAMANVGVSQPLPYGGSVSASALVQLVDALDNEAVNTIIDNGGLEGSQTSQLVISAAVPLMRARE